MSGWTLRGRFLALVILGVAAPLLILGAWLARSSVKAGEELVRSELDALVTNTAQLVETKWRARRSDVLLLAENEPIRRALEAAGAAEAARFGDTLPRFVRDAYAGMPLLDHVVITAIRTGRRWTLGAGSPMPSGVGGAVIGTEPAIVIRAEVPGSTGVAIGRVEAWVRTSALLPEGTMSGSGSPFVAMYDRARRVWSARTALPDSALEKELVELDGEAWLVAHRSLSEPSLDVVALGSLEPVIAPFRSATRRGFIALFVVAAIVVAIAIVMAGRLTASLSRLALAADAVAAGDLEKRVDTVSRDEVGRVAKAFNTMLASLKRTMESLTQREAMAAVGELAATIAHQVRSPATAIKLDLQLADAELPGNPEEARTLVRRALSQVGRLERAVTGSLRIARTGSGTMEPIDVRGLVDRVADDAAPLAQSRDVRLRVEGSGEPMTVRGDEAALSQMVGNVLTNAIEAARSRVDIHVAAANGVMDIHVVDDGAGMSEDVRARFGEPFVSSKPGGTGLGLAVARRVAAAHRGEIRLERSGSQGTEIVVRLSRTP